MPTKLPSRIYTGRTIRVLNLNCLEVDMALAFGIRVAKNLVLEFDSHTVPGHRKSEAQHCLVLIAGGRDLLIHTDDDTTRDGFIRARVYVDAPVVGHVPAGVVQPYGIDEDRVDVAALYAWAGTAGFDPARVREAMRGVARA